MLLISTLALAAPFCPRPDTASAVVDLSVADSGDAYVLSSDGSQTCWWVVADDDEARVAGRWQVERGAPVAVEALADGRALFAMEDGRLQVRALDGERREVRVVAMGVPSRIIAHPSFGIVAIVVGEEGRRVQVVDVDHEVVIQELCLPDAAFGLAFGADSVFVRVDRPKVSDAAQSRR